MKHFEKLYVWAALGIIVVLPFLYMDYGSKEYPELNKAIRVVRYMPPSVSCNVPHSGSLTLRGARSSLSNGCSLR